MRSTCVVRCTPTLFGIIVLLDARLDDTTHDREQRPLSGAELEWGGPREDRRRELRRGASFLFSLRLEVAFSEVAS